TMVDRTKFALGKFKQSANDIHILFTAHSIPLGMAKNSDYKIQLHEASALVAERIGTKNYKLVFQSKSGPPQIPWLEPDILDYIHELYKRDVMDFIIVPIGFISDHMEVMYDLDVEAQDLVEKLGMTMVRANTPGTHPLFIRMIRQLIEERMTSRPNKMFLGTSGPGHDICSEGVCEQESHNIPKKIR
ncbi:MAG: ferrochelatase, partial [Candidatus Heimdallarchaeota archaeon]|nr:ferrochelatase [Candidatus Heimdallarchaeota archaeon]